MFQHMATFLTDNGAHSVVCLNKFHFVGLGIYERKNDLS